MKRSEQDEVLAAVRAALGSVPKNRRYLIGVSGGRDSVVLLDSLHRLGYRAGVVGHFNHRLRGRASGADQSFVRRLAQRLGLEFVTGSADVAAAARKHKRSVETEAREQRYAFFARAARRLRLRLLLLGHHAGDRAETFLHHLFRGTGPGGLVTPRPHSERVVDGWRFEVMRPLLSCGREAIDYAVRERGLKYREDASNADLAFLRNRLRHQLLPTVKKIVGRDPEAALCRVMEILGAEDQLIESLVPAGLAEEAELSVAELQALHPALQRRLIWRWLNRRGVPRAGFAGVEAVRALLDVANGPAKVNLPGETFARRRRGVLFLEP